MGMPAGSLASVNSTPSASWTPPNFKPSCAWGAANTRTSAMANTIFGAAPSFCVAAASRSARRAPELAHRKVPFTKIGISSRTNRELPPNWHSPRTTCCAPWNIAVWLRFTHRGSRMIITLGRANAAAPACVSGSLELQYRVGELLLSAILLAIERRSLARGFRPRYLAAREHRFTAGRHPICGVN
jgi:hypothetical protein